MKKRDILKPAVSCLLSVSISSETDISGARMTSGNNIFEYFREWMQRSYMGVEVWQFLVSFLFILLGFMLKKISDHVFENKIIPVSRKTRVDIDNLFIEALSKPFGVMILLCGISGALAILPLPTKPDVNGFVFEVMKISFALDFLWLLFRLVVMGVRYLVRIAERMDSKLDEQPLPLINRAAKVTIWIVSFVWILQLLGYNISILLTGLGIGGFTVALALRDTLANFFGSIFIFLDRPFTVGDLVKIKDVEGIVENVDFRSTRIRTCTATLVSIPNKTVANATIDNLSRLPRRRVSQTIGVTYSTDVSRMESAVREIRSIIEQDEGIDKERITVRFSEFAKSSLNIMVVYFTIGVAFNEHFLIRERINLAIMRKLKELGVSIASPARFIYIENAGNIQNPKVETVRKNDRSRKAGGENLPF